MTVGHQVPLHLHLLGYTSQVEDSTDKEKTDMDMDELLTLNMTPAACLKSPRLPNPRFLDQTKALDP